MGKFMDSLGDTIIIGTILAFSASVFDVASSWNVRRAIEERNTSEAGSFYVENQRVDVLKHDGPLANLYSFYDGTNLLHRVRSSGEGDFEFANNQISFRIPQGPYAIQSIPYKTELVRD